MRCVLLPLLASLLLSSCVRWHIGAVIRDAADVRVGVDVAHPVDGKLYRSPGKEKHKESYYVLAPEVTYSQQTPWVELDDAPGEPPHSLPAVRIRPTGRVLWARATLESEPLRGLEHKISYIPRRFFPCFREEVDALPPDARLCLHQPGSGALRSGHLTRLAERERQAQGLTPQPPAPLVKQFGTLEYRRCWPATLVAAPFDYVIDPVLSGVSTAACWTGVALAAPFLHLAMQVQEWGRGSHQPAPRHKAIEGALKPAGPDKVVNISERPRP